jgi:hypothetical protein
MVLQNVPTMAASSHVPRIDKVRTCAPDRVILKPIHRMLGLNA